MKTTAQKINKRGYTLIEVMIAASLTGVILAGVYLMWATLAKSWMTERVKTSLNEELQVDITRMKKEMRLSSGNEVFYYPVGSGPYSAVSFPIPVDENGDNLIETDADGNIIWDRTIIYHIFNNGGVLELRRTVFSPRDNTLTAAEVQEQLETVVADGNGTGAEGGENASTGVLFSNLETFEIIPSLVTIDGYNDILVRTDYISFGSVVLTPGEHTLRFEVTGKNDASTDYHFAIDALVLTPSGGKREAEEMLPPDTSSGETAENVDLSAVGSWSGYAHMLFHANGVEDYVEFTVYNDEWIETNFDHADAVRDGTLVMFDADIDPPEIVLYLDGMKETWTADTPTGGVSAAYSANPPTLPELRDMTFRTIVTKESLASKGARTRVLFRAHPSLNNLEITSAYIEERSSGQDGVSATKQQLFFSNTPVVIGTEQDLESGGIGAGPVSITISAGKEVYSNWVDLAVDTQKDYLVSFHIADADNMYSASYYPGPAGSVNSYYRSGDFAGASAWSSTGTNFAHIVASVTIQVTHPATAYWTSQIYDTKIANPDYGDLTWTSVNPTNTEAKIWARSSDDAEMADDPAWQLFTSSPANIPETFTGRYIQFKAELTTQDPYYTTPLLQRVSIRWPGQETLVDIGGYFSKDTDYGIFKLTVDGQELSKSVEVRIRATEDYLGRPITSFISSEIEPRNTPQ